MAKKYGPLLFSHEVSYNKETFSEKVHTCLSPSLTSLAFILSPSHSFSLCFSLSRSVRQSLHQLKVEVSNTISIDTSFHLMRRLQTSLLVVLCGITYLPFTFIDTLSRTLPLLPTNKSTLTLSLTQ